MAVLAVAALTVRSCGSDSRPISSERAVEIARQEVSFVPDRHQVRLLQRGIPSRSYWGVSMVRVGADGRPAEVEVFLVDTKTGDVSRG